MNEPRAKGSLIVVMVVIAAAGQVQAEVILSPDSVINNTLGELSDTDWAVHNLINQSGLSSTFTSGVTNFDTYLSETPTHSDPSVGGVGFASLSRTQGLIDFDLGAEYTLFRMALWNDSDTQALGDFTLSISNDSAFAGSTSLGSFSGTKALIPVTAQVFDLTDASGRYVRLNILNTVGSLDLVNFGELAFDAQASVIPEPSTVALLGSLALCGIGIGWRRRRKA